VSEIINAIAFWRTLLLYQKEPSDLEKTPQSAQERFLTDVTKSISGSQEEVKVFCTFFWAETRTHHRRRRVTPSAHTIAIGTGRARQDCQDSKCGGKQILDKMQCSWYDMNFEEIAITKRLRVARAVQVEHSKWPKIWKRFSTSIYATLR
jgi:hypothetical protein